MAYLKPGEYPYVLGRGLVLTKKNGETTWKDTFHGKGFTLNITSDSLEHENLRNAVKTVDKQVVTKLKAEGKIDVDVPCVDNLLMFFYGDSAIVDAQTGGAWTAEEFTVIKPDEWQSLGKRGIVITTITDDDTTPVPLVEGVDYYVDLVRGLFLPLSTSSLVGSAGDKFRITGTYATHSKSSIYIGEKITKRHIWFKGNPATGIIQDIKGYCTIKPEGDLAFIGDEWQNFTFTLLFETHPDYPSPTGVVYEDLGTV